MRLSHESQRFKWSGMVFAWVIIGLVGYSQTKMVREYLELGGGFGLRGVAKASTPMTAAYPVFAADAQVWVRHAMNLVEGDSLRLRHTMIDNAPQGREVHWNSLWAWMIAGSGYVEHLMTGKPMAAAIEMGARWLGPLTLWGLTVLISAWAARRGGLVIGLAVVAAMIGKDRIYEGFFPSYVDHHGLLTVAVLGVVLGVVFMGAGWWRPAQEDGGVEILPNTPEQAREAAIFSALAGALGMWVSAASVIVPIAVVGVAGLITILSRRTPPAGAGEQFDAETWRTWGRVGALGSTVCYFLEYFPAHLGMRLEANHPLYSLAWLGGSELLAQAGERWHGPKAARWDRPGRLVWAAGLVMLPVLVIGIWKSRVFVVADPFLARLHADYIQEFQPVWKTFLSMDARAIRLIFLNDFLPALIGLGLLAAGRRRLTAGMFSAAIIAATLLGLGCLQARWLLNASAAQIPLVVLMIVAVAAWIPKRWRSLAAGGLIAAIFLPALVLRIQGSASDIEARRIAAKDVMGMLFRDMAATLRNSQPQGPITVLASPNVSTGVGYYGNFQTLGTLYWENNDGLKAAGAILSAKTDDEAAGLIQKYGVTHLAMVLEENFIAQYYTLLHPGATAAEVQKCFGHQVLLEKLIPRWLQILPYQVPEDLKMLNQQVMLFKVNFKQNEMEAFYHIAMTQIAGKEVIAAEKTLDRIIATAPHNHQPWLRKAEIRLEQKDWVEGRRCALEAAARMAGAERRQVVLNMAEQLYRGGQQRMTAEVYLNAMKENPDSQIKSYLTWILATSPDDTLRDGATALRLAEELVPASDSAMNLSIMAAALAENGRFPEALVAAERAVGVARSGAESALVETLARRAEVIRSGKPIRE
ncbi:MAG: hypothetical protein RL077_6355 [Verrucomicrobiota bacterium]|jgi:tetratricopeptide (TPR) repeat protein